MLNTTVSHVDAVPMDVTLRNETGKIDVTFKELEHFVRSFRNMQEPSNDMQRLRNEVRLLEQSNLTLRRALADSHESVAALQKSNRRLNNRIVELTHRLNQVEDEADDEADDGCESCQEQKAASGGVGASARFYTAEAQGKTRALHRHRALEEAMTAPKKEDIGIDEVTKAIIGAVEKATGQKVTFATLRATPLQID